MMISKAISAPFSELALDSHFEPTLVERLTLLTNAQNETFITLPEELRLEILFYKRSNDNVLVDQTELWFQSLKLKFGEELANILWHNNHRFLNFESKKWVLDSYEKIIHYAETKKTELKNHFPDLTAPVLLKLLQCGLWVEYLDVFKISKANLLRLTRPRKKAALLLMLEIKKLRPDLSHYNCKQLILHHPKRWQNVLLEIEKIKTKYPHLSEGYCNQLAIGYFKTWPKIIEIAAQIKNVCPELSDYTCRKLAVSYKNTWPKVLEKKEKIGELHPEINDHDQKYLAINYFRTWKKVLSKISEINFAYPTLTKERCAYIAIHHQRTWKSKINRLKKLFENRFIRQHFSETLLLDLIISRREKVKSIADNFENIIDQFRGQLLENSLELRSLDVDERKQLYFALVLLNTIKPYSQPKETDKHLSEKELLLWFKALLIMHLGRAGYSLMFQIRKTTWLEKNSAMGEMEKDKYDVLIFSYALSVKSMEQEAIEKENTDEFRQILSSILTEKEYQNLMQYSLEQKHDSEILKIAIQKIKSSPQGQLIREHLQSVVG